MLKITNQKLNFFCWLYMYGNLAKIFTHKKNNWLYYLIVCYSCWQTFCTHTPIQQCFMISCKSAWSRQGDKHRHTWNGLHAIGYCSQIEISYGLVHSCGFLCNLNYVGKPDDKMFLPVVIVIIHHHHFEVWMMFFHCLSWSPDTVSITSTAISNSDLGKS